MTQTKESIKDKRLTSKGFFDVEVGEHFFDRSGGYPNKGNEHVKTSENTSRNLETGDERKWENNYTVYVAAKCHQRLEEGQKVRVTRHTDVQETSSVGRVTGQESFEGHVRKVSSDVNSAWIEGDNGERQTTSAYAGDEHGYPVISVEII